ncbi:MAG: hypothetical protein Q4B70_03145 [Lachnospiraceae bacterium]|nr:hypothetical protein [Lachnospiraceae bacterium]
MSSVEAVNQAQKERDEAVYHAKRAKEHADYLIKFTKKEAQNEIRKTKRDTARQMTDVKTREGIWCIGMVLSVMLSMYYNQALQDDVWELVSSAQYLLAFVLLAGVLFLMNKKWNKAKRAMDNNDVFLAVIVAVFILEVPFQHIGINRLFIIVIVTTILTLKNIFRKVD